MARYSKGDWIEYRVSSGWIEDGKVLEVRPDDVLVVGDHDRDPNPDHVDISDVTGML